ncbi:TPA: helix-hairpin-helix domain-containing protein [Streptococcus suis]|nr:helix-hairpin-helix domain-containing protein [Streptococcus suis]
MAKKKVNRKKQLKKYITDLRRASHLTTNVAREVVAPVAEKVETVVEKALEQVKEVVAEVTSSATSLEDFLALPKLEGIAAARLETFYQAGIQSVADFANHTEKELLALKGIGPATIKQLKEKGIELKA